MAVYVVGDVQGCYEPLRRLLDEIHFDPSQDFLWSVGDIVNRGPHSLETLQFFKSLGDRAVVVLGNHDLHFLAVALGLTHARRADTLDEMLAAPNREELVEWLIQRPLMHVDAQRNIALLHAGLPPQWDIPFALRCAREVEGVIRGPQRLEFFRHMYGDEPKQWLPELQGLPRYRFIANCLTRLRYCDNNGVLGLSYKGPLGSQPAPFQAWFEIPWRASRGTNIVFGHWSALGRYAKDGVYCLDSGCLWGGELTLLRVDAGFSPITVPCATFSEPNH